MAFKLSGAQFYGPQTCIKQVRERREWNKKKQKSSKKGIKKSKKEKNGNRFVFIL